MSPSHATKRGRRYRYYVSQAILQGRKEDVGSVARVPAMELERRVVDAVRGAAPMGPRERSIETQIIQRVSDRPVAIINGAAGGLIALRPRSPRRPSRRRRAHHDPPHHVRDLACRRHRRRTLRIGSWSFPGRRHPPIDAARSFREKADDPLPCDRCELRRARFSSTRFATPIAGRTN